MDHQKQNCKTPSLILGVLFLFSAVVAILAGFKPSHRSKVVHAYGVTIVVDQPSGLWLPWQKTITIEVTPPQNEMVHLALGDVPSSNTLLVAKVELQNGLAFPQGEIDQPLATKMSRFFWKITAGTDGMVRGEIWVWLLPLGAQGITGEKIPIAIIPVEIDNAMTANQITKAILLLSAGLLGLGLLFLGKALA